MTMIPPVGDGIADDTAAVQSYMEAGERLPPGKMRITSDLAHSATIGRSPGITLRGAGMLRTKIIADYNADATKGGIDRLDITTAPQYTIGNVIEDLTLTKATGRTGLNG